MSRSTTAKTALPLTVLFAPAHTLIDETQGGSEYYWPYKLIERLALDHGVRIIALTIQPHVEHHLPGVRFVSVEPGGSLPASNLERLRFHVRVYTTARRILTEDTSIDVIHHMLPFGFRATFNLLALRRRRADPPIVIGPLQPPLSFVGTDESPVALRNFSVVEDEPLARARRRALPPLSTFITLPVLSALSAMTLRRANALVAISERAARLYASFTGGGNLAVIPPGVDTGAFTPRPSHESAGSEEGERFVEIIAIGYLMQRKAFDVLIRAVGQLAGRGLPVHLRLVGEGPARQQLEGLVRQLGIERRVTFAGRVPHNAIVHEYRRADIFCSPSLSEGFATVALEALACGLPLVATPAGGFRELLAQRHVGVLVRFGDVDGMASALAQLVTDRALREALSRQARSLAVQEYDWSVIAARYLALYKRLARTEPTSRPGNGATRS